MTRNEINHKLSNYPCCEPAGLVRKVYGGVRLCERFRGPAGRKIPSLGVS